MKIITLVKEYGFNFTPEDIKELKTTETHQSLSEEELDEVTGGRGQSIIQSVTKEHNLCTTTLSCDFMPSDDTFKSYLEQKQNGCNYFVPTCAQDHSCASCANLRTVRKDQYITLP